MAKGVNLDLPQCFRMADKIRASHYVRTCHESRVRLEAKIAFRTAGCGSLDDLHSLPHHLGFTVECLRLGLTYPNGGVLANCKLK